jgi:hypothetical protein
VRWRLLGVLLLFAARVAAGRIVVTCYDGSASATVRWPSEGVKKTRVGVCDVDRSLNGTCRFQVSLTPTRRYAPRIFDAAVDVGRRKRIRYAGTSAVLRCFAGPEPQPPPVVVEPPPGADTYLCQDAVLVEASTDPVCDLDQACDGVCTFAFHCPACCRCGAPCLDEPAYRIGVPIGGRYVVAACETTPALDLGCQAHPVGFACPSTTTTTLPIGACRTDVDCAAFTEPCQHCEAYSNIGDCEGIPTISPIRRSRT